MKALLILVHFFVLVGFGIAQDSDLSGVYVKKKSTYYRIEFLSDGGCHFAKGNSNSSGKYAQEKGTVICRQENEEVFRFQIEDGELIDQDGNVWVRREEIVVLPWKDVRPVTMVVLEGKTRKPITEFTYRYQISTPTAKYDPLNVRPDEVRSNTGEFTLVAPQACQIELSVEGKNILAGYGTWKSYDLTSDNTLRRIEVVVQTGVTVNGTVVEGRMGKPIAGASVSPIIFTPPLFTPDRDRAVRTDTDGKFVIQGVDDSLGINVWHAEYLEFGRRGFEELGEKVGPDVYSARIELETGELFIGDVRARSGEPLADVTVSDGAGKRVQTDQDGKFILASPAKWNGYDTYNLSFEKEGFLEQDLHPKSAEPKGFSILLVPVPVLTGQVLDPQGQPVENYFVAAGVTLEPRSWCCSTQEVRDPTGHFSLPVRTDRDYGQSGKIWIGVKSEGFAFWETTMDIDDLSRSPIVRLKNGVAVRGKTTRSNGDAGKITATILPVRLHEEEFTSEISYRQELGRMQTSVNADGNFKFTHVGPGQYVLGIAGPAVSPISTAIVVSDSDLDLGTLSLRGRGSVAGVIYEHKIICEGGICRLDETRGVWPFAEGYISFQDNSDRTNSEEFSHLQSIPFKADENGRFHVDSVPIGVVSVAIPFMFSADIMDAHVRRANVVEGKTTDVRFFDTSGQREVVCLYQIGDGSEEQFSSGSGLGATRKVDNVTTRSPMFEVQLQPADQTGTSFEEADWSDLDGKNQILLRDVSPGKYSLLINDWQGSRGLYVKVYEATVEAKEGKTSWTIPLGAGCITGAIKWSKEYHSMIHVIAVGENTGVIRNAFSDDQGNFCVRYLPEDDYTLWAHDDSAGWCEMSSVAVRNDVHDIGVQSLKAGGAITGKLPTQWQRDPEITIVAVDSHGIEIEDPSRWSPIGEHFTISNLWNDTWTIRAKRNDRIIAERKTVVLQGIETVSCDLSDKSFDTVEPAPIIREEQVK